MDSAVPEGRSTVLSHRARALLPGGRGAGLYLTRCEWPPAAGRVAWTACSDSTHGAAWFLVAACGITLREAATLLTTVASGVIQARWVWDVTWRQRRGSCSARCHLEFNSENIWILGAGLRAPPPTAQPQDAANFKSLSMSSPWPESPPHCLGLSDTTDCQPLTTLGKATTWAAQGPRSLTRGALRRLRNPPRLPGKVD